MKLKNILAKKPPEMPYFDFRYPAPTAYLKIEQHKYGDRPGDCSISVKGEQADIERLYRVLGEFLKGRESV